MPARAPDLPDVVRCHTGYYPRIVLVPGEVSDAGCVAAVHEEHLWWTVFGIFRRLLHARATDVPEDNAAVVRAGCEDGRVVRMPVDLANGVLVPFEGVDAAVVGEAQVEDADCLIDTSGCKELVVSGVEGQSIDSVVVSIVELDSWPGIVFATQIHQLHGQVIGDGAEEVLAVVRMILDVVDYGGVMSECAGRRDSLAGNSEVLGQVPQPDSSILQSNC